MNDDTSQRSPHDRYFKSGFSNPEVVRDYLEHYLPASVTELINLAELKAEPSEYIDENLRSQFSDLLYSCALQNNPAFCYFLFEHKSTPVRNTRLYLLRLKVRIWERWDEEHPGSATPVIFAMVINQGPTPWTFSPKWSETYGLTDETLAKLSPYALDFQHHLVDLTQWPLEDLQGGQFLKVYLGLIKTMRTGSIEDWLEHMGDDLDVFAKGSPQYKFLEATLAYLRHAELKGGVKNRAELTNRIKNEYVRQHMITLEQAIKEEGINEGRELGINEGRELGINEGLLKGRLLGQIELCRQLLGVCEDQVSLEHLEFSELEQHLAGLKRQISEREEK